MPSETAAIANRVMEKLVSLHEGGGPFDHLTLDTWEWPQGVALYAMCKLYIKTKDNKILAFLRSWYNKKLAEGLPGRNVNTTAPMLGLAVLYELSGEKSYLQPISDWAQWVMNDMQRTPEGGLQHITTHSENSGQLWDDTLFMTVLFLYRAGLVLRRKEYCEEAKYQFLLHIKYLHAPHNALWYHGFTFLGRHHFAGAFWARGNGWFTAGAVDFLEMIEQDSVYQFILRTWQEQCEALAKLQDGSTGLWHTLLDHEDSYLETSASAAIAYGLKKGLRLGLLKDSLSAAAENAANGVLGNIGSDGLVRGVSYGTPMGDTLEFYKEIPVCPTAYGQGLAFLMLTEMI